MGYFDSETNVIEYEKLAKGYDGQKLIERLQKYVPPGAAVLELGMGPGKDLDMLRKHYQATGSDSSQIFLDRYRKKVPEAQICQLDAIKIDTDKTFDAIYSNKVLHQLKEQELVCSFQRQAEVVTEGGVLLHSFWYGEEEDEHNGIYFHCWTPARLKALLPSSLTLIESERYQEMEEGDSLLTIFRRQESF